MTLSYALLWLAVVLAVLGPVGLIVWVRRRRRLGRPRSALVGALLFAMAWGGCVYATFIEPEILVVRQVEATSAYWTGPPIRLGLISDTHVGSPHMTPARMARIVARMNGLKPDMVLLLGDYSGRHEGAQALADPSRSVVLRGIAPLAGLTAPLGMAAVLGNHDIDDGAQPIAAALAAAGARVLQNQAVRVDRPGGAFWLVGLADAISPTGSRPAFAYAGVSGSSIIMSHEPGAFRPARFLPFALMVAGHTHCGQINLPLIRRLSLSFLSLADKPYPCGPYLRGEQSLYVTAGLGTSNLPMRFRAPPEIVILTLKPAPLASGASAH